MGTNGVTMRTAQSHTLLLEAHLIRLCYVEAPLRKGDCCIGTLVHSVILRTLHITVITLLLYCKIGGTSDSFWQKLELRSSSMIKIGVGF